MTMTRANQVPPSIFDDPIGTLASRLSALALSLPPLASVTLIIGYEMNVTHWPQNRPYLAVTKMPSGSVVVSIAHHSEVKIIKLTSRHEVPSVTGWRVPTQLEGVRITGWHKKFAAGTKKAVLSEAITEALNDLALTYFLHDKDGQRLWISEPDLAVLEELGFSQLAKSKILSRLPSASHYSLPSLYDLLDQESDSEYSAKDFPPSQGHPVGGAGRLYCLTNHRGRPTALILADLSLFGELQNLKIWNGERFTQLAKEAQQVSAFAKRLSSVPPEFAEFHWGPKVITNK